MSDRDLPRGGGCLSALTLCLALAGGAAVAQPAASPAEATSAAPASKRATPRKAESSPTWRDLTPPQQQALAPLATTWPRLSEAHKAKWLALSSNYPSMPAPEQARLHSRMAEWAALSPQQRTQARMNFAESKAVPTDDKRAKWEAYQALPPEEKRKLAAGARAAKPAAPPTAAALQPEPRQKLAKPPREARTAKPDTRTPRIAATPGQAGTATLPSPPAAAPQP